MNHKVNSTSVGSISTPLLVFRGEVRRGVSMFRMHLDVRGHTVVIIGHESFELVPCFTVQLIFKS